MQSARILTDGLIDYAGLFPPASRGMAEAVTEYATHLEGPDAAILGRFIIAAPKLPELTRAVVGMLPTQDSRKPWRLSALLGEDFQVDVKAVLRFNSQHWSGSELGHAIVDTVEIKAADAARVKRIKNLIPDFLRVFVELSVKDLSLGILDAIRDAGFSAKMRTGGVEQSAFPKAEDIIGFLRACLDRKVAFKATAGLHHIVCGSYPLTYDVGAARGDMFGFVNVFLAAAFLFDGASANEVEFILRERSANAFRFRPDAISWGGRKLSIQQLAAARKEFAISFGSCSFTEPVEEFKKVLTTQGLS